MTLTDGSVVERDVTNLLRGPVLEELLTTPALLQQVRVEAGTVGWPNGADLCPDMLIWGGAPPEKQTAPPQRLIGWK